MFNIYLNSAFSSAATGFLFKREALIQWNYQQRISVSCCLPKKLMVIKVLNVLVEPVQPY